AGTTLNLGTLGFQDANASASTADFTATVTWGDGTSTPGTVAGRGGQYTEPASHAYATNGSYAIGVTIRDDGGSSLSTTGPTVSVVRPLLSGAGDPVVANATGAVSNAEVATFTDA